MIQITRMDRNWLIVRAANYAWDEEKIIKAGTYEWNRSERAYTLPRPRIVDVVDGAKKLGLEVEYPPDLYQMEKMAKIAYEANLSALRAIRQTGMKSEDIEYFKDHFKGKHEPRTHQLVTFMYASMIDHVAIFNDMGTGKTASAIWSFDWRRIQKQVFSGLVVAPNSILENWVAECALHAPHLKVVILRGTMNERLKLLDSIADLFLINYEGLQSLSQKDSNGVYNGVLKHRFEWVCLDEGHKMKDPGTKTAKIIQDIFETVTCKLVMTGTPIGNILLDLHQPMTWLDPFIFEPFHIFRAHYFSNYGFKWMPNEGTERMIQDKVYMRAVRYRTDECLDLPETNYITRTCVLEPVQSLAYQQMLKAFVMQMEEGFISAKNVLAQIVKLSQITSGFIRDQDGTDHVFVKSAKLDLLESTLDEIGDSAKVVIWARYIPDIKRIGKLLNKDFERAVLLYGATAKGGNALKIVDRFQNEPGIRYLVGNPAVGGLGLNMTAANYAIYYSNDYSWIKRSQSEARIRRMGSEIHSKITIIDLCCFLDETKKKMTIDFPVVDSLRGKKELARVIIDLYSAGIGDAFSLIKEKKEAEDQLALAAENLVRVTDFVSGYKSSFELEEPACPVCNSKNIHRIDVPGDDTKYKCLTCEMEWA